MDKVLKINFNKSKEDIKLYNWIITHENMEELVKTTLREEMNNDLDKLNKYNGFEDEKDLEFKLERHNLTKDQIRTAVAKIKGRSKTTLSSKDLEDLFNDDSFWD